MYKPPSWKIGELVQLAVDAQRLGVNDAKATGLVDALGDRDFSDISAEEASPLITLAWEVRRSGAAPAHWVEAFNRLSLPLPLSEREQRALIQALYASVSTN